MFVLEPRNGLPQAIFGFTLRHKARLAQLLVLAGELPGMKLSAKEWRVPSKAL